MKKSNDIIIRISKCFEKGKFSLKYSLSTIDNEYIEWLLNIPPVLTDSWMMLYHKQVKKTVFELLLHAEDYTIRSIKYIFNDEISGTSRFVDPEADQERTIRRLFLPITPGEAMLIFPHLP